MVRTLCYFVVVALSAAGLGTLVYAQKMSEPDPNEPRHIRGQVIKVDGSAIEVKTKSGEIVRIDLIDGMTVIGLTEGKFTKVDFGVYVGSVAVKLDEYSPIVRDSLSWLHEGYELRIIDEELRGIAVGHRKWSLTPDTIIAHGWVDDIEDRVLSIKYGPTEEEETDVEVGRDVPVLRMSLADKSLIKPDAHIFAGAQKNGNHQYAAMFVFVGENGLVPPL